MVARSAIVHDGLFVSEGPPPFQGVRMKRVVILVAPWLLAIACGTTAGGGAEAPDAEAPALDATVKDAPVDEKPVALDATPSEGGLSDTGTDAAPLLDASDASMDAADAAPPPMPEVQYIGRWDFQAGEASAAYPASRAIVRFRGTGLEVTARDTAGRTWLDVTVDGVLQLPVALGTTPQVVTLAENLAVGDHVVEVYKRTEDFNGVVRLSSFTYPGGGQLLAPPPRKVRHVEIIGNSTLSGYGVDGVRGDALCNTSSVHNAHRSLIALLAAGLDAEEYAPSVSGTGVLTNENPVDTNLIFSTYPRVLSRFTTPLWDFSKWQPDAIVVMIGGTDLSNPQVDPPPSQATFATAYEQFLALVRSKNPNAHVFAATSPTTSNFYPTNDVNGNPYMARTKMMGGIAAAVASRNAAGDTKVYPFVFSPASDADLGACAYHPTFTLYQRMASEIVPFIKTTVGW